MEPSELAGEPVLAVYITTDGRDQQSRPAQIFQCLRKDGRWGGPIAVMVKGADVGNLATVGIDPEQYLRTAIDMPDAVRSLETILKGDLGEGQVIGTTTSGNWMAGVLSNNKTRRWWGRRLLGIQELYNVADRMERFRDLNELEKACQDTGRGPSVDRIVQDELGSDWKCDAKTYGEKRLRQAMALWDVFVR